MDSSKSCVVTLAWYIRRHFSCDLKIHISCLLCLSDPYLPSVSLTESVSLLSQWLTALYNEQSCLSLANEASSDEYYLQVRVDSVNCLGITAMCWFWNLLFFPIHLLFRGLWHGVCVQVREQLSGADPLPPPCGFPRSNAEPPTCQWAPLFPELSRWANQSHF